MEIWCEHGLITFAGQSFEPVDFFGLELDYYTINHGWRNSHIIQLRSIIFDFSVGMLVTLSLEKYEFSNSTLLIGRGKRLNSINSRPLEFT